MSGERLHIAILGLGIIGGSLAYALQGFQNCVITGYAPTERTRVAAKKAGAIHNAADNVLDAVKDADLVIFASSPETILKNMEIVLPILRPGTMITEICGVKKEIFDFLSIHLPSEIHYIGLHPMAGKEVGGFSNADPALFQNAGFIIVTPEEPEKTSQAYLSLLQQLSHYVGAGRVVINTAQEHDLLIAYSSDLMHIAATGLCVSYPENLTMAHTAGAFRDCTRIANIDADLWTELLLDNGENIIPVLDTYIQNLIAFSSALKEHDAQQLHCLLQQASENKRKILTL